MRHGPRLVVALALAILASAVWLGGAPAPAEAAPAPTVALRPVAQLTEGTAIASRAGDERLFVARQDGMILELRGRTLRPALDLTDVVSQDGGERGLLGLAFAPDGGHLYVDYTDVAGDTQVVEFAMAATAGDGPDEPDPKSARTVLTVPQPQANHNGGQLAFGPDGLLYIGMGDGGGAGDSGPGHVAGGNAQSLGTLLGKILRIDPRPAGAAAYSIPRDNPFVGQSGARGEIWAYGLRNPWRFSFDRATGDLWIGDVGQSAWEEIDVAPATSGRNAGRGANFGWNRLEGTHSFTGSAPSSTVTPVVEISHERGACSVIGGFVYRGRAIPALRGTYLYTDYCDGQLRGVVRNAAGRTRRVDLGIDIETPSSFGERVDGELYVLSQQSGLLRLVPA
jgi:glucose/arabinose dehydrogenase